MRRECGCRSPHGERGLKCRIGDLPDGIQMSLSSWRAWIEMPKPIPDPSARKGRSPHGERGLKWTEAVPRIVAVGRSPHGERGLKWFRAVGVLGTLLSSSLSSWRAWIEICDSLRRAHVWKSLSSWRAWIEMKTGRMPPTPATCRSPHGERGLKYVGQYHQATGQRVALLMESVD